MDISSFLQSVRSVRVSTENLAGIMKKDAISRRNDYGRIQELDRRLKRVIPIIPGEFGVAGGIFGTSIEPQTPMFGMPMRPPGLPPIPPPPLAPPGPPGPGPGPGPGPAGPIRDPIIDEREYTIEDAIRDQERAKAEAQAARVRAGATTGAGQEAEAETEKDTEKEGETTGLPIKQPRPFDIPDFLKIIDPKALKTLMDKYYDPKNRGLFNRPFTQTVKVPTGTLIVEPTSTNIFRPDYSPNFRFIPNEKFEKAAKELEQFGTAMEILQSVMVILSAFGRRPIQPQLRPDKPPTRIEERPSTTPPRTAPGTVPPGTGAPIGPTITINVPQGVPVTPDVTINVPPTPAPARQVPARARVAGPETPMVRGIVRTPSFAQRQRDLLRQGQDPRTLAKERAKKSRDRKRLEQAREFLAQQGEETKLGQMTPQAEAARRQAIKDMISIFRDPSYFASGVVRPGSPADLMGMNNPALRAKFIQYLETFTPRTGQEINYNAIQKRLNAIGLDVLGETGPAPGLIGRDTFRNILNFIKKPEVRKDFKIDPRDLLQRLEKSNRIDPDAANFYRKRVETESNQLRQSISGQEVSSVNIGPGGPQIALQRVYIYRNA